MAGAQSRRFDRAGRDVERRQPDDLGQDTAAHLRRVGARLLHRLSQRAAEVSGGVLGLGRLGLRRRRPGRLTGAGKGPAPLVGALGGSVNGSSGQSAKARVTALFERLAPGYDHEVLRLFPFSADRMVARVPIAHGDKVLDVATGTGVAALTAAQLVGSGGRVMGIDLSDAMLARAQEKARALGLSNIDLHCMDAESLEFRRDYFDVILCGFGLFLVPDMAHAVREWCRVVRPGGWVIFSAFAPGSFEPLAGMLFHALEDAGLIAEETRRPPAWQRLADAQACRALLAGAGLEDVRIEEEVLGYHLVDAAGWWDVVWNSGLRVFVESIEAPQRDRLRAEHLAEVARIATADGIRLEVNVRFAWGRKPPAKGA
ncbi:MAG TPA: methyltransferase domain-containing protein [Chromatiales bacterium]|nr:methyltransferase domain-containing protein [Chromatiales bacterium]